MRIPFYGLFLFFFVCASCVAPESSRFPDIDLRVAGETTDPALAARMLDELSDLSPVEFSSRDGALTGAALAQGRVKASKAARGYMISVELGSAEPLKCTVQDGVLGLSAFARSLADAFLATHDAHELEYAFAGAQGDLPYLVLHGQYLDRAREGSKRRTGFLKMVVVGRAEVTVACFHDQFGYRDTVERVALSLAKGLEWTRRTPLQPLVRRSVFLLKKDGEPAGSREVVIRVDDEDFRRSWIRTAFLELRGPQQLLARDVLETYDSDPDGRVFAQTYQDRQDGKVLVELNLKEQPPTDYEVTGRVGEEASQSRFTAADGLPDLLQIAARRRAGQDFERFLPQLSAGEAVTSVVRKTTPTVTVAVGERSTTGEVDEAGYWVRGTDWDGYSFERTALDAMK